jgi:hypothetical protein
MSLPFVVVRVYRHVSCLKSKELIFGGLCASPCLIFSISAKGASRKYSSAGSRGMPAILYVDKVAGDWNEA